MFSWKFAPLGEDERMIERNDAEFFAEETLHGVADPVVRECVQNSLDARKDDKKPLEITFTIGENKNSDTDKLFEHLWDHVAASNPVAGERKDFKKYRYLLVEDFKTTGLRGETDPKRVNPLKVAGNDYFCFVRGTGVSGKTGEQHGKWGVGKFTFLNLSEINTIFVYTVRSGKKQPGGIGPYAVGTTVLDHRTIGGEVLKPDGFCGDFQIDDNGKTRFYPFGPEAEETEKIYSMFNMQRGLEESGLSVAIPFIPDSLTRRELGRSVIRNYGMAIIWGSMTVKLADADGEVEINKDNIRERIEDFFDSEAEKDLIEEIITFLNLGEWAETVEDDSFVELASHPADLRPSFVELASHPADLQPSWNTEDLLTDAMKKLIEQHIKSGENFAVKIPITIEPVTDKKVEAYGLKPGGSVTGHMEIYYSKMAEIGRSRPHYYRRGLRVSGVKPTGQSPLGYHALVRIRDVKLVKFLGEAEGISHTNWDSNSKDFKEQYRYGPTWLRYIRAAPTEVLVRSGSTNEIDKDLASDWFSVKPPVDPSGKSVKLRYVALPGRRKRDAVELKWTSQPSEKFPKFVMHSKKPGGEWKEGKSYKPGEYNREVVEKMEKGRHEFKMVGTYQEEQNSPFEEIESKVISVEIPIPEPEIPPTGRGISVNKVPDEGSFIITLSDNVDHNDFMNTEIVVDVAYQVFKGDAFSLYREADFNLDVEDMKKQRTIVGGTEIECSPNRIKAKVSDPKNFKLTQKGFGLDRDLVVFPRRSD